MIGLVLAGGKGTRMGLFTKRVGNKHLMPIYDRLMIEFPIMTLVNSGIKDITIVTGSRYSGSFLDVLGDGKEWGIEHLSYAYQFGEGGIADALRCAEYSIGKCQNESICVILGDNIFEDTFSDDVKNFICPLGTNQYAKIFLKEVHDPERFGVVKMNDATITDILEKPKYPPTNLAVTGLYMYTRDVFTLIDRLKPSQRNELEISDLNKIYLQDGNKLDYSIVNGFWGDAGTPESLLSCSEWVKENY